MNTNKPIKIYILPILLIGILVAMDQLTKQMICGSFALYETKPLIKNVFHLTYIQNTGIAWGMFQDGRTVFLILTIIVLLVCACFYAKIPTSKRFLPMRGCLIFLVAGAIGNMIDRINLHYVVDFFDFRLINFPVFNVADIYVTCSMILLILLCLFYYNEDEIDEILSFSSSKQKNSASAPETTDTENKQ